MTVSALKGINDDVAPEVFSISPKPLGPINHLIESRKSRGNGALSPGREEMEAKEGLGLEYLSRKRSASYLTFHKTRKGLCV